MQHNMGRADRILRGAIVAVVLFIAAILIGATSVAGIVLLALAAVMVGTALIGFCPLYNVFGISTCKRRTLSMR